MLLNNYRKYDKTIQRVIFFAFWAQTVPCVHTAYAATYVLDRDLHTFAGAVELCFIFCMNFPSATIRAAEFPLVYPEVNNL